MNIRVAIIGPTGYTGYWLIDWLLRHPSATITYLASSRAELPNIAEEYPRLLGRCELVCRPIDPVAIAREADVAFTCLPHKAAMSYVPKLLDAGLRVIDLSADYRLKDVNLYESVYDTPHEDPENIAAAAYGLPEVYRSKIADADLVACPGCYPTAATLGVLPLLQRSMVRTEGIVINATTGITGAGRSPKPNLHYPEANEGFSCYNCGEHRHQPEIEQTLSHVKGQAVNTLFTAHLLPLDVGILETIYMDPLDDQVTEDDLYEALEDAYGPEPFVRVRADMPNVKHVRDTNCCDLAVRIVGEGASRKVVVFSAIDNMVKGSSGQAIQNMNIMFKIDEKAGLM